MTEISSSNGVTCSRFSMCIKQLKIGLPVIAFFLCASSAHAQSSLPYGAPISLDDAKRVATPALAEARKNNWNVAVAIVDYSGNLVYYEKMDGTQLGSVNVSIAKARSAALFKRPTKAFQDVVAAGGEGLRVLRLEGAVPLEGGVPIIIQGMLVGAIGVSGVTSQQDGQVAMAGVNAVK